MRNKIVIIVALFFLAFMKVEAQSLLQNGKIPKDLFITLERTGCYGNCPDYKLSINSKGVVIFRGGYFTKTRGNAKGKISRDDLKRLIAEFETSSFFKLRDSYEKLEDGCEMVMTDHASQIISIQINGKTKKVSHYFGCRGIDKNLIDSLEKLGKRIDEITNSTRWIEPVKSYEEGKTQILKEAKKKSETSKP